MGRSQDTYNKKEVRNKQEKKRKDKEAKRLAKKDTEKSGQLKDMIAYVDENGVISTTPPDPAGKEEVDVDSINISVPKRENVPYNPIRNGIVTFFNESKGFGFIRNTETQESIFVHVNNVLEPIKDNNMVVFEVEMGPKGPSAFKVKLLR